MQRGVTHKHPVIVAAPIGLERSPTTITACGEILHQVADIFTVGELACARHGKDRGPVQSIDQLESDVGGIAGISHHDDLTYPRGGLKVFEHLPEQDVLMPLALGINRSKSHGDAKAIPTGNQHDHAKAKGRGRRYTLARYMAHGMLASALGFMRRVTDQVETSI